MYYKDKDSVKILIDTEIIVMIIIWWQELGEAAWNGSIVPSLDDDDDDKLVWRIREVMIDRGNQNTETETLYSAT
jgi:hypothetical protein